MKKFTSFPDWSAAVETSGLTVSSHCCPESGPSSDDPFQDAYAVDEIGREFGVYDPCDGFGVLFSASADFSAWQDQQIEASHLEVGADWQTQARGSNSQEYQIYLACADNGKGGDITRGGAPLKTFDEWVAS